MNYAIRNIATNETFSLREFRHIVGREPGCDILVDKKYISRHHADIFCDGDQVTIIDNNSTNGTFVNDVKIAKQAVLRPEDQIRFGKTIFEFYIEKIDITSRRCQKGLRRFFSLK